MHGEREIRNRVTTDSSQAAAWGCRRCRPSHSSWPWLCRRFAREKLSVDVALPAAPPAGSWCRYSATAPPCKQRLPFNVILHCLLHRPYRPAMRFRLLRRRRCRCPPHPLPPVELAVAVILPPAEIAEIGLNVTTPPAPPLNPLPRPTPPLPPTPLAVNDTVSCS